MSDNENNDSENEKKSDSNVNGDDNHELLDAYNWAVSQ
jgi:hypothetical protein